MARRYDSSTTTFSPEGRLHQVEYAIEAINNAGTCVGILAKDGIVMASEKRVTSGLLAPSKVRITWYTLMISLSSHPLCFVKMNITPRSYFSHTLDLFSFSKISSFSLFCLAVIHRVLKKPIDYANMQHVTLLDLQLMQIF